MSVARPSGFTPRPVVVTGVGAVSAFGWGVEPLWNGLRSAATAILPFDRFAHDRHRTHLAAQVPPAGQPAALAGGAPAARRQWSMADRFALAAGREALRSAGLDVWLAAAGSPGAADAVDMADRDETAVFFGSSTGGMWESEAFLAWLLGEAGTRCERGRGPSLHSLASQQVNGPGDAVARYFGVTGPVQTVSSACASGALAIGEALTAVRWGEAEIALAGGADSLCELTYAGFNALRSVDEVACRPFRAGRAGMSFGEGAAVLVLEPLERALARGAVPIAELGGAGAACDAYHMTAPEPGGRGAEAAIAAALADAGLAPDDIDFVNAHATGTPLNDAAEWHAMERVFGERARRIPVTATKAAVGHLLGSSGALEAVVTALSLQRGELHPVPAAEGGVDEACPVALVMGAPLALPEARAGVSTSLAFGGSNAALVFTRWAGGRS